MKQTMVESILANDYKKYFLSKIEFERDIISCYNSEYSFFLMNIEISNSFSTKNFEKAESLLTYKLIELFGENNRIYKTQQGRYKFVLKKEKAMDVRLELNNLINFFKVPVRAKDGYIFINLKIGLVFSGLKESIEKLVLRSRLALLYAKENNFSVYHKNMYKRYYVDLKIEELLYEAYAQNEFEPFFQAYVNTDTQEFIGAEVLMRWIKSDEKIIPPNMFIPILEKNKFIIEVELKFIRKIFDIYKSWQNTYSKNIPLSINVSAVQLSNDKFISEIEKIAKEFEIEKGVLTFEITESYVIDNIEEAAKTLNKLKELGFNISLDDFGTGYATLTHLKSLPIDVLKIDMTFIKSILTDKKSEIIVKHIIDMAHKMDLKTICEGVETEEQYIKLKELGSDIIQGFYFAKPIPKKEFEEIYIY
ncbi:MAG: EAL domain-containing protein [Fusobacteriaceae bacterium]|nr:EAL domain-containing protein [Fusobacteriaceae bacterium]